MNFFIVARHNRVVMPDDDVYVLGDLCLGGGGDEALSANKKLIESLNGRLHILRGNHDTPKRLEMYKTCENVVEDCGWATMLEYHKYHFYLSHYPTLTSNIDYELSLKTRVLNLCGHTHSKAKFDLDSSCYHVEVDAHACYPVLIEQVIEDLKSRL